MRSRTAGHTHVRIQCVMTMPLHLPVLLQVRRNIVCIDLSEKEDLLVVADEVGEVTSLLNPLISCSRTPQLCGIRRWGGGGCSRRTEGARALALLAHITDGDAAHEGTTFEAVGRMKGFGSCAVSHSSVTSTESWSISRQQLNTVHQPPASVTQGCV